MSNGYYRLKNENGNVINNLIVTRKGLKHILVSYDTEIAVYDQSKKEMTVLGYYSRTSARHLNYFLSFFGFEKMNKKQIIEQSKSK